MAAKREASQGQPRGSSQIKYLLTCRSIQRRVLATAIDITVIYFLVLPLESAALVVERRSEWLAWMPYGWFWLTIVVSGWFLYAVALEAAVGATAGKWFTGLRVRNRDGGKANLWQALLRNLGKLVEMLPPVTMHFLLQPLRAGRSLGDQFSKTSVISNKT